MIHRNTPIGFGKVRRLFRSPLRLAPPQMGPPSASVLPILCFVLLIALVTHASPSPQIIAPWPVLGHDSSSSKAAPLTVPVFTNYTSAALPFYFPGFEPGADPEMYIPAPGIYVLTTPNNITLYNRTANTLRSIDPQPGSTLTPDVLGFDPSGSLRMYVFTFGQPFGFGAYSIPTGAMIWSVQNASMREIDALVDTVTDSVYASFYLVGQGKAKLPYIARYDGATGSLLWVAPSGQAGDLPASIGGNSPVSGALIYGLSNPPSGTAARSASTGDLLWKFDADLDFASLEVGEVQFNYDGGGAVYGLNTTSGTLLWNSTVLSKLGCNLNGFAYAAITLSESSHGVVTVCTGSAQRPLLIIIDMLTGSLLYKLTAATPYAIESIVTVGPNVFYTSGSSVYRWLATSRAASAIYTSGIVPLGNLYVDSDGALMVAPQYGATMRMARAPAAGGVFNTVQLLTGVQE